MRCVLVQTLCKPGTSYKVAETISDRELHSDLFSVSGDFDIHMKIYVPENEDIRKFINNNLLDIDGIERTVTTLTSVAF